MRLIDADKLLQTINQQKIYAKSDWIGCIDRTIENINEAPTVDIETVPKGKWIHEGHDGYNNYYRCSNCNHLFGDNGRKHDPYCSHCGAKMEGVID